MTCESECRDPDSGERVLVSSLTRADTRAQRIDVIHRCEHLSAEKEMARAGGPIARRGSDGHPRRREVAMRMGPGRIALGSLAAVALVLASCAAPMRLGYRAGQVARTRGRGMVVADDPIAAGIGAAVLARGGNAVDAAVATAFAMAATYPQAVSPGGGGFALVARKGDPEIAALDFREIAPSAAKPDMFLRPDGTVDRKRSLWSGLAVAVPGMPAGLAALHARFGRRPWRELLAPAVRLAREGFPIPRGLAEDLDAHRDRLAEHPGARAVFVRSDRPWRAGDLLRQPDLARTLAAIRDRGPEAFHRGPIARAIAREVGAEGGILTAPDLAAYRPVWREPARFAFPRPGEAGAYEITTMPLPSSGGVALREILGIFEAAGGLRSPPGSAQRLHTFLEAERRAFADRNARLGDPIGVPREEIARLTSQAYIEARARTIDAARATPSAAIAPGELRLAPASGDTTNICAVDREGGAAVLTISLNATFGSHILARGTGVLLNNHMDDFAARPGAPNLFGLRQGERNAIGPGRKMLSSMSPTIARDGDRVILAVGAAGGPKILTSIALVIARHLGDGLPLDLAVLAPRGHHQHLPDEVVVEDAVVAWPDGRAIPGLDGTRALARGLAARGHAVRPRAEGIGRLTAIAIAPETGEVVGAADPRAYGAAAAEEGGREP